jgi:AICAR transformylase/IMP cyclohydrolase PurH
MEATDTVDLVPVRRALISVSDKTGLIEFATALANEFQVQLISTGGTAAYLRDAGLAVTDVAEVTGFPEMMDGRVKTLHPKVHGGLLGLRDHKDHLAAMWEHGIEPIDLLCVNLYPFAKTIKKPDVNIAEAIENIDIGGPAMIRSAAKNHAWVVVVTAPARYDKILGDLRKHEGKTCLKHRRKQAQSAFAHTAEYDGLIAKYLAKQVTPDVEPEGAESTSEMLRSTGVSPVSDRAGHERDARATESGSAEVTAGFAADRDARFETSVQTPASAAGSSTSNPAMADLISDILNVAGRADGVTSLMAYLVSQQKSDLTLIPFMRTGRDVAVAEQPSNWLPQKVLNHIAASVKRSSGRFSFESPLADKDDPSRVICNNVVQPGTGQTVALIALVFESQRAASAGLRWLNGVVSIAQQWTPLPSWAAEQTGGQPTEGLADRLNIDLAKKQTLRYGENPHQSAALYVEKRTPEASVACATQHHGKELSYINLLDADGALSCVKEFTAPAACIVKHTTPCGCATADGLPTAFKNAYAGDPLAAFGGIVALNKPVDLATAEAITSIDKLLEVIVAPSYANDALELLKTRWKNVRLLSVGPIDKFDSSEHHLHKIVGGYLVQERDLLGLDEAAWKIASTRKPTGAEIADLRFAWLVCKHVKSNAIVVAGNRMLFGAGAGQMDRPSAARLAIEKAGPRVKGSVAASDAFFPFPDGPKLLLDAGVTAIIHPGGSLKDQETIDLVNARGAALVLTGQRHFKH